MEEEIHAADEEAAAAAQGEEAARVAGGAGEHRPPGAALPRGTAGQRGAMEKRFLSSWVDRTGRRMCVGPGQGWEASLVRRAVGGACR